MDLTTAISVDPIMKNDHEFKGINKSINGNQAKATTTARSFGRELGNFEAQGESVVDTHKGNVQNAANHKENFLTSTKDSFSNENTLDKTGNKQAHMNEQEGVRSQQAENNQTSDEDNDKEEMCAFDKEKENDPQYLISYVKEIFTHLRETEERYTAKAGYIAKVQDDVNEKMRGILVDWLVDVHIKFKLLPETLFLAVNVADRYLEQTCVPRQKLQLVGVTALLIASKYEEIYPPEVKEFEYVTDRAYSREDILDMEGKMINCLNFNLTLPSSLRFLERYGLVAGLDEKMTNMTKYLLELSLVDYKMLKYNASTVACAAIYLINKIHKKEGWSSTMAKETKYTEAQIRPCAKELCVLLQSAAKSSFQAVRRKFSSTKYMQVAKIQLDKI